MTYLSDTNTVAKKDDEVREQEEEEEDESGPKFDQTPVRAVCPHCGLNITTFIEHESSWVTYVVSIVLLLVLQWAALCVVPVVFPLFKDVVHHCPRCLSVLATRSRVVLPSFKQEVMTFRFGSCVIVLARKWVITLVSLASVIMCVHAMRGPISVPTGVDAVQRGELASLTWEDFVKDCGFKSYLGNPIHVTTAFNENYKNRTFHWQGSVHHVEEGLSFLWWSQKGALVTRMNPPQFPSKRDLPDLVLLYNDSEGISKEVSKLRRNDKFDFEATMLEVGRRGAPHVMVAWEVHALTDGKQNAERGRPLPEGEQPPQAIADKENLKNSSAGK